MPACMPSHFSHVQLFATPWTAAHQSPLSMEFSRQEYWSALPSPPSGDLPDPGIKLMSPVAPALQVDSLVLSYQGSPSNEYIAQKVLDEKCVFNFYLTDRRNFLANPIYDFSEEVMHAIKHRVSQKVSAHS